jgi:phytoene dehydrogenase-like protein
MHLHLGFRADGLSERVLESIHHIVVPSWEELTAPQQTVFVSIPSLLDPSLAPAGRHVLHAYVPATEPYEVWEGMDRRSDEYKALKAERAAPLWRAIERFIPDIRERAEVTMVGSPLTHERFLRRHRGTYGPELRAGERGFPSAYSKVDGLLLCGDSTFPGIGVPAVAGSGIAAAHAVSGVAAQRELLREMDGRGVLRPALP